MYCGKKLYIFYFIMAEFYFGNLKYFTFKYYSPCCLEYNINK